MIKLGADQAHRCELDDCVDVIHMIWDGRSFLLAANLLLLSMASIPNQFQTTQRAGSQSGHGPSVELKAKHQDTDKVPGNSEGTLLIRTKAFQNR